MRAKLWLPRRLPEHPTQGAHRRAQCRRPPRCAVVVADFYFGDAPIAGEGDAGGPCGLGLTDSAPARHVDARGGLDHGGFAPAALLPVAADAMIDQLEDRHPL